MSTRDMSTAESVAKSPSVVSTDMRSESTCLLCERESTRGLTKHHLIPKCCHKNKWFRKRHARVYMQKTIAICRDCHDMIHRFIPSEKVLGREFSSVEQLRAHPELANYLRWRRR